MIDVLAAITRRPKMRQLLEILLRQTLVDLFTDTTKEQEVLLHEEKR